MFNNLDFDLFVTSLDVFSRHPLSSDDEKLFENITYQSIWDAGQRTIAYWKVKDTQFMERALKYLKK